ncbi:MAG: YdcF family protein [Patescibacteria group bacterium]
MGEKELDKIKLAALVFNDRIKKSDVVVCLEGDHYARLMHTLEVFQGGWAERILVSGGYEAPPFSIPARVLAEKLYKNGIPRGRVLLEEKSLNSYDQGVEVMKIIKEKKWKKIILVASHFHQPRAYLTFLKTMKKAGLKIQIFNSPARELSWFNLISLGKSRLGLFEDELNKIDDYSRKGHVATVKEAIEYQEWKEKQK